MITDKKSRVLLVEDMPITAIGTQALLESKGLEVIWAKTGREAIEEIEAKNKFNFILLDLELPDMPGYEIIKFVHAENEAIAKTPIIILTAHDDKENRDLAEKMNVEGYLSKPIRDEDYSKLMTKFL